VSSIITSYKKAFLNDSNIIKILSSKDIKALSQLRHVLVHQNGIVDQTFINNCAEPPTVNNFSQFRLGKEVLIDGEMVRSIVDPVVKAGYELLLSVDAWIATKTP
jgi:hypothetical protein